VATVADCDKWGRVTGTLSGNTLTGRWYKDYGQQGDIILTVSGDGKSFTGKYNYSSAANPFEPNPDDPEDGWYETSGMRQ